MSMLANSTMKEGQRMMGCIRGRIDGVRSGLDGEIPTLASTRDICELIRKLIEES